MKDKHGNPVPLLRQIDIPPIWLFGTLVLQSALHQTIPLADIVPASLDGIGWLVMLAGFVLIFWSAYHFQKAQTPIHPRRKPTTLITSGPFALSRNPIYLGMVVIALGWALRLGSVLPFLLAAAFLLIIDRRFVAGEEFHIDKAMGDEWQAYIRQTRRWL